MPLMASTAERTGISQRLWQRINQAKFLFVLGQRNECRVQGDANHASKRGRLVRFSSVISGSDDFLPLLIFTGH